MNINTKNKIFFIIGNPRSGTNAITEIFNTASNAEVYIEQEPKLRIASRLHYELVLPRPKEFIYKAKIDKIKKTLKREKIYGDKNPNYLVFVEELVELWNPKFIFIYRDPRDVVRSLIDFNKYRAPIYARYEDNKNSNIVQIEENKDIKWDFSKLRPRRKDSIYNSWQELSLFEKCCWSWAKFNEITLEKIKRLEKDRYRLINIDKISPESLKEIFEFLNLKGFNSQKIQTIMSGKRNSIEDLVEEKERFPHWKNWKEELTNQFNKYCQSVTKKLYEKETKR